jgi:hypothetical protein
LLGLLACRDCVGDEGLSEQGGEVNSSDDDEPDDLE